MTGRETMPGSADGYIRDIYRRIAARNPMHAKKLRKNLAFFDARYHMSANAFLGKYSAYLGLRDKTLDYAVDCYLNMIADMNFETIGFHRTGKYSSTTFEEVNRRVYAHPETMEYYMHGLLMSQFLWKHHYLLFDYFAGTFPEYAGHTRSYLEIGAGHGLYLSKALEILDAETAFTVVDVSRTSVELARKFTDDARVRFEVEDIFDFEHGAGFDFITMGEVLEHVEDPGKLMLKVHALLSEGGTAFISAPTNAPAIDHIFLFNNVREIRDLAEKAGFTISSERWFSSEDVSPEKAEKLKVTAVYGAFLEKPAAGIRRFPNRS